MIFEIINNDDLDNFINDYNIKYLKEKENNNDLRKEINKLKNKIKILNKEKTIELKQSTKSVITTITKNINGKLNTMVSIKTLK
tara:strand:+ start:3167 stop:3418 length:252 start_codon:yes stop_codon:yes gene_type:complete